MPATVITRIDSAMRISARGMREVLESDWSSSSDSIAA
jgi:hypothetical protein